MMMEHAGYHTCSNIKHQFNLIFFISIFFQTLFTCTIPSGKMCCAFWPTSLSAQRSSRSLSRSSCPESKKTELLTFPILVSKKKYNNNNIKIIMNSQWDIKCMKKMVITTMRPIFLDNSNHQLTTEYSVQGCY